MGIKNSRSVESLTSPVKGSLAFYTDFLLATLTDVAYTCYQSDVELDLDCREIRSRAENEGMPFLTRTLPTFAKAIDLALATGTAIQRVSGFKTGKDSVLPRFLRELTITVFDDEGNERSDASVQALTGLRQLLYLFYKLELPPTKEQEDEVIQLFIDTDRSLPLQVVTDDHRKAWTLRYAKHLIARVLGNTDPRDSALFRPRHGPGAVATGEKGSEKVAFKRYYSALSAEFPYEDYFYYNLTHFCDDVYEYQDMRELVAGTAKVVLVPKDSRGPRLISCEPLEYQWIQQGLMNVMVKTIERHKLTAGRVNFTDQTVNQRLALESSLSGEMATLDMKEASDRVSLALVKALFPDTWFRALDACRTTGTTLPDGTVFPLRKFAPMGSATCFPTEALIFWALTVAVISYGLDGSQRREASKSVFVYGDDIICRLKDQELVRQHLPSFDLKFNETKCCTGRFFRESCGMDAYKGSSVTPLKIKAVWSPSLAGSDYASWVEYHNSLNERGLFNACDFLAPHIQAARLTPYADSLGSAVVALVDCRKMAIQENKRLGIRTRFCSRLHVTQVYSWVVRSRSQRAATRGWAEMLRVASYTSGEAPKLPIGLRRAFERLDARLAPDNGYWPLSHSCDDAMSPSLVTAYQYTLPRQVTLRRGWGTL